jgi:hypothetical protein
MRLRVAGRFLVPCDVFLKDDRMNTVERIGLASAAGATVREPGERARVPLEVIILAMVVVYAAIGPLTDLLWCAGATSVLATVVTLRRMRAEVRELRDPRGL